MYGLRITDRPLGPLFFVLCFAAEVLALLLPRSKPADDSCFV